MIFLDFNGVFLLFMGENRLENEFLGQDFSVTIVMFGF